jgi:hypothetical protein
MKQLLLICAVVVLVVGCREVENGAYKHRPNQTNAVKPVKELTAEEEKVVGEYGRKTNQFGDIKKWRLLKDGGVESLYNDTVMLSANETDATWKVVNGEIQVGGGGPSRVYRINEDESITFIARIGVDGERKDFSKEDQLTFNKIN